MEAVNNDMRRLIAPCLGLWEYTHTNEDGVMQYRLAAVAEDDEAAQRWASYRSETDILRVSVNNSTQGGAA